MITSANKMMIVYLSFSRSLPESPVHDVNNHEKKSLAAKLFFFFMRCEM
ncbi:hypothetical protein MITSMUL_04048 [Mitsuokella multacida DSM 20544]|uniref:Uncharacterized protein n=1 Tax=Mitsuokella multacida DSM 20544 TaxID=500635 RepID=C9KLG4_9FIRM|nr:hypothetical protein MITSMUL_04048 [Mitsuokella multacida DSM 20544]